MIQCIFTLDYEVYGNGEGSLRELVWEPAEKLKAIFLKRGARFVAFVEIAELEMMEVCGTDRTIGTVARQLRDMHAEGFELGLHLHPQWYNGVYELGAWRLDYGEYNLCTLPRTRIEHVLDRALAHFRKLLADPGFTPLSFRAGNWLFQPARPAADVLASRGIRVDSSVFKGGLQRAQNLDYRRALENGSYWTFADDVTVPDPSGSMLELPIYSRMVRPWRLCTMKRASAQVNAPRSGAGYLRRVKDYLRLRTPQKLDFCRMSLGELTAMVEDAVLAHTVGYGGEYLPLVAIGHTKDLRDTDTVEAFLAFLEERGIGLATLNDAYTEITCRQLTRTPGSRPGQILSMDAVPR